MIKTLVWVLFFFIWGQINLIYVSLCSQSVLKAAGNILPGCHRWACETLPPMDAKNHHCKHHSTCLWAVLVCIWARGGFVLRALQGESENQMCEVLWPQPILGMESELYRKEKRSILIIFKNCCFCSARGWYTKKNPKSMGIFSSCDTQTDLKFRGSQQFAYLLCFSINSFHNFSV